MADYNKQIPDYGYLLEVQEYLEECGSMFTDYDGHGHPVKDDSMNGSIYIKPSNVGRDIPKDATHIMWFNR